MNSTSARRADPQEIHDRNQRRLLDLGNASKVIEQVLRNYEIDGNALELFALSATIVEINEMMSTLLRGHLDKYLVDSTNELPPVPDDVPSLQRFQELERRIIALENGKRW